MSDKNYSLLQIQRNFRVLDLNVNQSIVVSIRQAPQVNLTSGLFYKFSYELKFFVFDVEFCGKY